MSELPHKQEGDFCSSRLEVDDYFGSTEGVSNL